jgi:hypothetical protein
MAEMTREQIESMSLADILARFRRAAQYDREHIAITWEHGQDLVNIIAVHGDKIADADIARTPSPLDDVARERRRQIEVEGWSDEHDDKHAPGDLAQAGACYALADSTFIINDPHDDSALLVRALPSFGLWPWASQWWKPRNARRNLVRAAALIIAEIDRLDRADARIAEGRG